jgi:hypothetical protein
MEKYMNLNEIKDIYNKMGIGTDEERRKFIDMSNVSNNNQNEYFFIQYSPISSLEEEKKDA